MNEENVDLSKEKFDGTIPDHQIVRCIGIGSFGRVWLALNSLGNYRAVKTIERGQFTKSPEVFELEWEGIKKYEEISSSHPRLVTIFHAGRAQDDGYFYYVMELGDDVDSGRHINPETYRVHTLQDHIFDQKKRLPLTECVQIGIQLSGALEQFHINGLLHRDVKPSNIIFVNGVPKLTDMGLVIGIEESDSYLGTDGFIPPEGPNTVQADIYSLGKTLYEAASGLDRKLFPNPPREWKSSLDKQMFAELNEVLVKACHPSKKSRFTSARQMQSELLAIENGKSLRRYRLQEQALENLKNFTKISVAIIVLLVALVLVFGQSIRHERQIIDNHVKSQLAYIAKSLKDNRFGDAYEVFIDSGRSGIGPGIQKNILESRHPLIQGWAADFPVIEFFGQFSYKNKSGGYEYFQDGRGTPLSLNNCTFFDEGQQAVMVGDYGFAAVLNFKKLINEDSDYPEPEMTILKSEFKQTVRICVVSPDESKIFIGGDDWSVNIYDARTLDRMGALKLEEGSEIDAQKNVSDTGCVPNSLVFSPDGRTIAVAFQAMHVALFDAGTFKQLGPACKLDSTPEYNIQALAWSPSGRTLLGGGYYFLKPDNRQSNIFAIPVHNDPVAGRITGVPEYSSTGQWTGIWDIKQQGDRPLYFFAGGDGITRLCEFDESCFSAGEGLSQALTEISLLGSKSKETRRLEYSPDLGILLAGGWDNKIRIHRGPIIPAIFPELPHSGKLNGLSLDPGYRRLFSVCHDGSYYVWNMAGKYYGEELPADNLYSEERIALSLVKSGEGHPETIRIYDLDSPDPTKPIEVDLIDLFGDTSHHKGAYVTLSLDGGCLNYFYRGDNNLLWHCIPIDSNLESGNPQLTQERIFPSEDTQNIHYNHKAKAHISSRGNGDQSGFLKLYLRDSLEAINLNGSNSAWKCFPDMMRLAVIEPGPEGGSGGAQLAIYQLDSAEKIAGIPLHDDDGVRYSLAFSPESDKVLVTRLTYDFEAMTASLYALKKSGGKWGLKEICEIYHDDGIIDGHVFNAGNRFVTLGEDSQIRLWSNDELQHSFVMDSEISSFSIADSGKKLVAGTKLGNIYMWDLERYLPLGSPFFVLPIRASRLSLSEDGRWLGVFHGGNYTGRRLFLRDLSQLEQIMDPKELLQFLFQGLQGSSTPVTQVERLQAYRDLRSKSRAYFEVDSAEIHNYYKYLKNLGQSSKFKSAKELSDFLDQQINKNREKVTGPAQLYIR